jgi:F0F1-type ATP synthase assembly protein I
MLKPATRHILTCAIAAGLLFAVVSNVSVSGSAASGSGGATPGVEMGYSPTVALIGFLPGALLGAGVGYLWSRQGTPSPFGLVLVTLMGGFAGLAAAALLGAQTVVAATNTSSSMEHGAPLVVLISGALLGIIVGAVCAWRLWQSTRFREPAAGQWP